MISSIALKCKYCQTFIKEQPNHVLGSLDERRITWHGGIYAGQLMGDKPQGKGMLSLPDGTRFFGEWKEGRMNGGGSVIYPKGERYEGEWKDGKKHGQGTYIYQDGRKLQVVWEKDELIGPPNANEALGKKTPTNKDVVLIDKDRVKIISKDNESGVVTYGYDDILNEPKCTKKNEDVIITRMYREYSMPNIKRRFLYKCNKSEQIIQKHNSGEEYTMCINGERCANKCICYNCLAACGNEIKWTGSANDNSIERQLQEQDAKKIYMPFPEHIVRDMFDIIVSNTGYEMFGGFDGYKSIFEKIITGIPLTKAERQIVYNAVQDTRFYFNSLKSRSNEELKRFDFYYQIYIAKNYSKELKEPPNNYPGGGCYIATAVYGSYDAQQVLTLRHYRDNYLNKCSWGRKLVRHYYKYSPKYADKLVNRRYLSILVRKVLNGFVLLIGKKKH